TLVMSPARPSVEMSMQHLSVGPSAPARAVIAVFAARRNAETVPAQKISERFISAGTAVSAAAHDRPSARGFCSAVQYRSRANAERAASRDARVAFPALIGTAR